MTKSIMNVKQQREKIITVCVAAAVFAAAACLCRPVFYLNDDVTMRSVLSGSYTGTPDGHAVYMKYPLTLVLSVLYGLAGSIPWLELFFAGCLVWSVAEITAAAGKGKCDKVLGLLAGILFVLPFFLYMHYTIIAAVLAGTVAFLLCKDGGEGGKVRLKPVLFWLLAWMVRSQVAYLAGPFIGVAVLWNAAGSWDTWKRTQDAVRGEAGTGSIKAPSDRRWFMSRKWCSAGGMQGTAARNEKILALGKTAVLAVVCFIVCFSINHLAYMGGDWQTYLQYNDARTQLYDYTNFHSTGYYGEHYEEYGMTEAEFVILNSYNTMLDESIDAEKMEQVAENVTARMESDGSGAAKLKASVLQYYYQIRYGDNLYVFLWLGMFAVLVVLLCLGRCLPGLLLTICLGGGRSLIWIFLIYRGRFPERISTSLYIIELLLLIGMLLHLPATCRKNLEALKAGLAEKWKAALKVSGVLPVILLLCVICLLTEQVRVEAPRTLEQVSVQKEWSTLKEYCESNEDTLYLLDVFSAVEYGGFQYEKDASNLMLAGGWMSASPLAEERFEKRGAADGAQALYEDMQTVFLAEKGKSVEWLAQYLTDRFGTCRLEPVGEISCGEDKTFVEHKVVK